MADLPSDNAGLSSGSALGSQDTPESVLVSLMNQRAADPMNLGLRDQEHAAFSRYVLDRLGPILGPPVVATSVPAYSAAKALAQPMGFMAGATPASLREVKAGLSPLWDGGTPPGSGPSAPPPALTALTNKLYTVLRLLGVIR